VAPDGAGIINHQSNYFFLLFFFLKGHGAPWEEKGQNGAPWRLNGAGPF
jgi:hypothetical protein